MVASSRTAVSPSVTKDSSQSSSSSSTSLLAICSICWHRMLFIKTSSCRGSVKEPIVGSLFKIKIFVGLLIFRTGDEHVVNKHVPCNEQSTSKYPTPMQLEANNMQQ